MPRRTTMPAMWNIPTSGPAGPRTPEDLLASNPWLQPWAELSQLLTEARARQFEILNRMREAIYPAMEVCRMESALMTWIEGMTSDAAMMFESFESAIHAIDRHVAKKFDNGLTNAAIDAMPAQETAEIAAQYPAVNRSRRRMKREENR